MSQENQEQQRENVVRVNTDPNAGPLDVAEADVKVAKTVFHKGETAEEDNYEQQNYDGNIKASYELGVVSITIPSESIMLTVRIDELMQVLFTTAGAYRKLSEAPKDGKDEKK